MAATQPGTLKLDPGMLERVRKAADERGLAVPEFVYTALEHEMGEPAPQPPFSLIGAFKAGRTDLSARASRDEFEPRPFR